MGLGKQFLEIYKPSAADVYDSNKEKLGGTIESILEVEMDDHLSILTVSGCITMQTPAT